MGYWQIGRLEMIKSAYWMMATATAMVPQVPLQTAGDRMRCGCRVEPRLRLVQQQWNGSKAGTYLGTCYIVLYSVPSVLPLHHFTLRCISQFLFLSRSSAARWADGHRPRQA